MMGYECALKPVKNLEAQQELLFFLANSSFQSSEIFTLCNYPQTPKGTNFSCCNVLPKALLECQYKTFHAG